MHRSVVKIFVLLFCLSSVAWSAEVSEEPVGMSPLFSQPLFNSGSLSAALPTFETLGTWKEFSGNSGGMDLGIFSRNSYLAPVLLSPILNELSPESVSQLKEDIAAAAASTDENTRQALVAKISSRLKEAQEASAPKVFSALKAYYKEFQKQTNSSVSPGAFNASKDLDAALLPLAKIYAISKSQKELVKSISRDLTSAQVRHITETLKPFWKSGQNPKEGSYAWQLMRNSSLYDLSAAQELDRPAEKQIPASSLASRMLNSPALDGKDTINIAGQSVARTLFPNRPGGEVGDDIPSILARANLASQQTQIAMYEETLDQDVDSILAGIKQGKSYDIIVDYSNMFPEKMGRENQEFHQTRSPQLQKLVDAYLAGNKNLQISILKGLGRIGIQHSKYRLWNIPLPNGQTSRILQTGSYNYSAHTQASNWENVVLIDDQKLIDLYQKNFTWMKSIARTFSEDLDPEEPSIQSPIPADDSLGQSFNGVSLPVASFSPEGGTDDAWIQIVKAAKQEIFIGMFAFYPWPSMMSELLDRLGSGLPVRILADQRQSHNAASIAAMQHLKEAGAQVRVISGLNNDGLFHNKLVIGDPKGDGIVATGSTNMSVNGTRNNFENTLYLKGGYLASITNYLEALWSMATESDLLQTPTRPNPESENPKNS